MRALQIGSLSREAHQGGLPRALRSAARFVLHFLEMCVVMCAGGKLLTLLFFGSAGLLGYPDVRQTQPALSGLVIVVSLAVAMVLWMRFVRRMQWRPTLEMAGSSVAAGVVAVSAYEVGLASPTLLAFGPLCGISCLAMLPAMLARFGLYSSGHHVHAV